MGIRAQPAGFADLLQRYRRAAGLTQEELAERAHLSVRGISNLERGVRRLPQRGTVVLLADALGLQAAERGAFEGAARGLLGPAGEPSAVVTPPAGIAQPRMVGRAKELALLARHLRGEGPPVLLFAGEPGIGKSRVLQEAQQQAARLGWGVLQGGCRRRGGQEPYAPVLEALEASLRAVPPARLRTVLQGCAWLVRLLPELAVGPIESLPDWTLSPDQERRLLFKAVGHFLQNVAGPAGTLLILDDLQWAGADALDLLAALMRTAEAPLRVVGAYRDTEVAAQDSLSITLADLAHARLATQHTLVPLTPSEVVLLADQFLTEGPESEAELRERALRRAGGVPFFVISCAQGLRESPMVSDRGVVVPWDLAQSLRQRIASLAEGTGEVLGAAAVIGRAVSPSLLIAVAEQSEQEVLAVLDGACRARILVEAGQLYYFVHDVIREVVEADAGSARRMALHRRVVRALESDARNPETNVDLLAYHSRQAGDVPKALRYTQLAGDRAARMSAYRDAVAHYEAALALLDVDDLNARSDLLGKLGEAVDPLGDTNLQLRYWQEAQRVYELTGDRRKGGNLSWRLAVACRRRGEFAAALDHLQSALTILESGPPSRELALTYSTLSQVYSVTLRCPESIAWGQKALDLATELGDAGITASALINIGAVLVDMGETERGLEHLERSLTLAEGAGQVAELVHAHQTLGFAFLGIGDCRRARDTLRAGLSVAERTKWETRTDYLLANLGGVELELGHWDEARDLLEQALQRSEAADNVQHVWCLLRTGELLRRQGRLDAAAQMLEGLLPACEKWDDCESLGTCLRSLALVRLASGDLGGAVAAMDRCLQRWQSRGVVLFYDQAMWSGIEVYLHVGRDDRAHELLEDLASIAGRVSTPAMSAYLADARGLMAAHERRYNLAAAHSKEAAEHWHEMGWPYQEALARWRLAEHVLRCGTTSSQAEAIEARATARAIFLRLGAPEPPGMTDMP